ncbi:putative WRKY transcription factor 41 [Iris pallida]|uniref:WRKY transcription factor 41 n=1 Tax=Iris pallida TaxID=29817 RepID=A0AAX6E0H8_IRIPA|nr:putative WRKY transcription factor 41 [Iris pallida]
MEVGSSMVVEELARGREMTRQLQADIESGSSADTCRLLAKEILSAFDKSISMVTSGTIVVENSSANQKAAKSPLRPLAKSPCREGAAPDSEVQLQRRVMCKKRKMLPKWTSQVRLDSGPGVEGPIDDGYKWRKYGQKDILGAEHPRGYYRCTHRNSQGCPAMKQVQRSDDNPLVFDVTYRGAHTCRKRPLADASASQESQQQQQNQELLLSFQTGLKVKTEGLDFESPEPSSSSLPFSFPSTPVESTNPSSTLDDCLVGYGGAFSNAFFSPATSESNYFSMAYGGQTLQAAESDFTETVSAMATWSATANSPMLDMDLLLESVDLDLEFPFDACSFLS